MSHCWSNAADTAGSQRSLADLMGRFPAAESHLHGHHLLPLLSVLVDGTGIRVSGSLNRSVLHRRTDGVHHRAVWPITVPVRLSAPVRIKLETKGPNPLSLAHHQREWIDACKGGPSPLSNFDYAGPLTETVLLGTIAIRTGQKMNWDGPCKC